MIHPNIQQLKIAILRATTPGTGVVNGYFHTFQC